MLAGSVLSAFLVALTSLLAPAVPPALTPALAPAQPAGALARTQDPVEVPAAAARDAANPFAGRPWGSYGGPAEMAWAPYVAATGAEKELLGRIALTPKAKWFGDWIPTSQIGAKVREYVANAQAGDRTALVQFTVFRMVPWEGDACRRLPTRAETADYKAWTRAFAAAVGDTPSAIVLQPDGPFALCAPGGSRKPSRLIGYSTRKFAALPNTSVYLEAGAADWPHPAQGGVDAVLRFLLPAGIEHARGVALNGTHYSSTADEVRRGADIVTAPAARGIPGKKVVVNTSSNGRPFEFGTYQGPDPDHAWACRSATDDRTCVLLGIPPTSQVDNPVWGLPDDVRALAAQHVDAYLWFGRPWLRRQNAPFLKDRALQLARTWPYAAHQHLR